MARVLFDHECISCFNKFEEFVDPNTPDRAQCPRCGSSSTLRLIGCPMIDPRMGLDAATFPTMGDKWEKKRRQRQQIENRQALSRGE